MFTRSRQHGFALPIVLMLIAVTTTLGLGYLAASTIKLQSSENLTLVACAESVAESGLEHALYLLRESSDGLTGTPRNPQGPFTINSDGETYTFWAEPDRSIPGIYRLGACGTAGQISREVAVTVYVDNTFYNAAIGMEPENYWRLSETSGKHAEDDVGNDKGKYEKGVLMAQDGALVGEDDFAARFDGYDDHVEIGDLKATWDELTLMAWIYIPRMASAKMTAIISNSTSDDSDGVLWELGTVNQGGERRLVFRLQTDEDLKEVVATGQDIVQDEWHLVVAVYTGSQMALYLDGERVASGSQRGSLLKELEEEGGRGKKGKGGKKMKGEMWIGGRYDNSLAYAFEGWIDEVGVFSDALTDDQIAELYELRYPSISVVAWDD